MKRAFNILDYTTESFLKEKVTWMSEARLTKTSHNFEKYGSVNIINAATRSFTAYHSQAQNLPSIALIEVVLAANRNYNKHVLPNINRLKRDYPTLIGFDDLNLLINNCLTDTDFFKVWGPKDHKKYQTLKNILDSIEILKTANPGFSDYEILNDWANKVVIEKYNNDIIGKHKNIAIATLQHLRMTFGANTVKPDQRAIQVIEKEFGCTGINQLNSIKAVEQMSVLLNMPTLLLDQIFVLYGSGYYNRHEGVTVSDEYHKIKRQIAKKLKALGVKTNIISESTGLKLNEISKL